MSLTPAEAQRKHDKAFRRFYQAYPKHVAPTEALRVFADLVENKGVDPVKITAAAEAYAGRCGDDLKYVPSPHSWLKQGHYDDVDLFADELAGQVNWLKQQWKTVNVRAVENRYGIEMPKQYPPEDMTEPDKIEIWYREAARAWITTVYREKFECPQDSQPTTNEPNRQSSEQSSTPPTSSDPSTG